MISIVFTHTIYIFKYTTKDMAKSDDKANLYYLNMIKE